MTSTNHATLFTMSPLVPLAISLSVGIAAGWHIPPSLLPVTLIATAAVIVLSALAHKLPDIQTLLILIAAFMIGAARMGMSLRESDVTLPDKEDTYEAVVASEAERHGKVLRLDAVITGGEYCGRTVRLSFLHKDSDLTFRVNDGLRFRATLCAPSNFPSSTFDYERYMRVHGIMAQALVYDDCWERVQLSTSALSMWQRARLTALWCRGKLLDEYRDLGLAGMRLSVAAAVTLGHKGALTKNVRTAYSSAGVAHVLALSGLHISILYMVLSLFIRGRRGSLTRETLIAVVIWAFVVMVGMPPSAVRAGLMTTVYSMARVAGRGSIKANTIALAALVMLLANPFSLFDVGWQMSFAAIIAIMLGMSVYENFLYDEYVRETVRYDRNENTKGRSFGAALWRGTRHAVVSFLVVTLSAQAGTFPLVAYYFGTMPLCSLLSNTVVSFCLPAILCAALCIFATVMLPAIQAVAASVMSFLIGIMNDTVLTVSSWTWSTVEVHLNFLQTIFLYVAMVGMYCLARQVLHNIAAHDDWAPLS